MNAAAATVDSSCGMGADVIVTEVDPVKALEAKMEGYRVMSIADAAKEGDIFVTVTGNKRVIGVEHIKSMKDGAIIANSGHFNIELDIAGLKRAATSKKRVRLDVEEFTLNGKRINLLTEGRLVNLGAAEGHPASVMDMSFSNHSLASVYLLENDVKPGVHVIPEEIDRGVARMKLETMGVAIDELTPDLVQTDPELGLPGGGNSYCGPVAVSNSLMWLAGHGCPSLAPPGKTAKEQQLELVRQLSTNRYMSTSPSMGTGATGIMRGLERYLNHRACPFRHLAYQGWRGHPARFSTGVKTPELEFVRAAVAGRNLAWINVGWYRLGRGGRAYRRHGGHWLTVVGAGVDEAGRTDPNVLILHDPAPYAGEGFANEYVHAERIPGGWLVEGKAAFPARGHYRLTGGMHIKRDGEIAILDGVIALTL